MYKIIILHFMKVNKKGLNELVTGSTQNIDNIIFPGCFDICTFRISKNYLHYSMKKSLKLLEREI